MHRLGETESAGDRADVAAAARPRLERRAAFHLAMREAEHRQSGSTALEEAEQTARRQFGNPTLLKEQTRDAWVFPVLRHGCEDIRFAGRSLRRSPGFTLVAVLTLGLSVGMTTAMFTLVDALILRPIPFRAPGRLAFIFMGVPNRGGRSITVAPAVLRAWRASQAFAGVESAVPNTALVEANGSVVTAESPGSRLASSSCSEASWAGA